jgi:hypothetical protein
VLFASLLVGVRSSGAVCGERERQTWDTLLMTPLNAQTLIRAKHRGILQATHLYLLAYAAPALIGAALIDGWAAVAMIVMVALCWMGMYFMAAVGLWCSVRSQTSWRSLLGTLAMGYGYGLALIVTASGLFSCCLLGYIALMIGDSSRFFRSEAVGGTVLVIIYIGLVVFLFRKVTHSLLETAISVVVRRDRAHRTGDQDILKMLSLDRRTRPP